MLLADYPGTFFTLQIEETSAGNTQRVFEMMGSWFSRPARKTLLKTYPVGHIPTSHPYNFRLTPKSLLAERV